MYLAICSMYLNNLRNKSVIPYSSCSVDQLSRAELIIVRLVPCTFFKEEILCLRRGSVVAGDSKLTKLNPFLDKNQFIRVGGRLSESSLSYDIKFPLVLPRSRDCHISKFVVSYFHSKMYHQGRGVT